MSGPYVSIGTEPTTTSAAPTITAGAAPTARMKRAATGVAIMPSAATGATTSPTALDSRPRASSSHTGSPSTTP